MTSFYLASPFFNEEQKTLVNEVRSLILSHSFKVFSPMHDNLCKNFADKKERHTCYNRNIQEIIYSDFVIAITDGLDVGTIFEAGYAARAKIPIIYLCTTLGNKPFNLMLAESGIFCKSIKDLNLVLISINTTGKPFQIDYEGEIQ